MSARFYCDGCDRHIEGNELSQATLLAQQHQKADLFCTICSEFAQEFWLEQADIAQKLNEQVVNTITKHRKKFFAEMRKKPKLEAVK